MDLAFDAPVDWQTLDEQTTGQSHLSDDFCEVRYSGGEVDRFIRCLLPIPVRDAPDGFRFGVWMSVSERSWNVYSRGFGSGKYAERGCFGYLMHDLPGFRDTLLMPSDVIFQAENRRPLVFVHGLDSELFRAQRDGVDLAKVEEFAAAMHQG